MRRWVIAGALILALVFAAWSYARAMAEADLHADRIEELADSLQVAELGAERLMAELFDMDARRLSQLAKDSARIAALGGRVVELDARVAGLELAEREKAESLEGALAALGERLGPEDLPYLRHVRDAQQQLLSTLRDQIGTRDEQIALRVEETGIVRLELAASRRGRRAADLLVEGLRSQLSAGTAIRGEQALEIKALRKAVAPGFLTRLTQNVEMIGITAAATVVLVLVLR